MNATKLSLCLAACAGILLPAIEQARAATPDEAKMVTESKRIVSQYKTLMQSPPGRVPSRDVVNGPLLGNGNLGAVISGPPEAQKYWISKNNFWRLKDGHRQGGPRLFGGLDININDLKGGTYRVEQDIYPAITISTFTKGDMTVTMKSWVAATADYLLVELSVTGKPVERADETLGGLGPRLQGAKRPEGWSSLGHQGIREGREDPDLGRRNAEDRRGQRAVVQARA